MAPSKNPEVIEIRDEDLDALLKRAEEGNLLPDDMRLIVLILQTFRTVKHQLDHRKITLERLRRLLFGPSTESTTNVTGKAPQNTTNETGNDNAGSNPSPDSGPNSDLESTAKRRAKGHGRNGADDFKAAERVPVSHPFLQAGDPCPACTTGTLYRVSQPGVTIRFVGQPPVQATIYELEKLRCQLCGTIFTAEEPAEAGDNKFDATTASIIGVLKYGGGFPFNRLQNLQANAGIPLPASTQWQIVRDATSCYLPVFEELLNQASAATLVHNDDTWVAILERMGKRAKEQVVLPAQSPNGASTEDQDRTGLFTTGIVAEIDGHRVVLFRSGIQHAGENLKDLFRRRDTDLPPPIQMCDALSRNYPKEFATIVANCLAHARRKFVDLHTTFSVECEQVLTAFREVYLHDAEAKRQLMSPEARLAHHQQRSVPVMEALRQWMTRQLDEKLVEPNSALGEAIAYLSKHWEKLTLFLRVPGAPLDNNICERVLKRAILHRKNSLFYKTMNGAHVGDVHMSLIATCEQSGVNAFEYLTALQRHAEAVAENPDRWLPWNYHENVPVDAEPKAVGA